MKVNRSSRDGKSLLSLPLLALHILMREYKAHVVKQRINAVLEIIKYNSLILLTAMINGYESEFLKNRI